MVDLDNLSQNIFFIPILYILSFSCVIKYRYLLFHIKSIRQIMTKKTTSMAPTGVYTFLAPMTFRLFVKSVEPAPRMTLFKSMCLEILNEFC